MRQPVEIIPRKAMHSARKRRIHEREAGKCWLCTKLVPQTGPDVRYDHRVPLELGGTDDDANIFPLHREPCDRLKTAADMAKIAKVRRLIAREDGTRRPRKAIPNRPWPTESRSGAPRSGVKFDWSRGRYVREDQR
jgi:hypothetical protein